jgi:hypothetical protein
MKNHLTPLLISLLTITSILILSDNFLFQTNKAVCETENSNKSEEENEYVSKDGMVHLENDMDIIELIKAVSEINEEVYILDESVKPQKVGIITPVGGMKKEDFVKFFDIILNINGLSVVKTGGVNKVINSSRIKRENTPTIIDQSE